MEKHLQVLGFNEEPARTVAREVRARIGVHDGVFYFDQYLGTCANANYVLPRIQKEGVVSKLFNSIFN
jgi:hypothetical protein